MDVKGLQTDSKPFYNITAYSRQENIFNFVNEYLQYIEFGFSVGLSVPV